MKRALICGVSGQDGAYLASLLLEKGYVVHGEMAYQAWVNGFLLGEVPIHFKNRARDASKLSAQEIYMALLNFALLRFRYGFRPKKRARPEAAHS